MRDVKGNKKSFSKYINSKRKTGKCVPPAEGARDLVTCDMKETEVLKAIFTSVFTSKTHLQKSEGPETKGKVLSKEGLSLLEEDQVRK